MHLVLIIIFFTLWHNKLHDIVLYHQTKRKWSYMNSISLFLEVIISIGKLFGLNSQYQLKDLVHIFHNIQEWPCWSHTILSWNPHLLLRPTSGGLMCVGSLSSPGGTTWLVTLICVDAALLSSLMVATPLADRNWIVDCPTNPWQSHFYFTCYMDLAHPSPLCPFTLHAWVYLLTFHLCTHSMLLSHGSASSTIRACVAILVALH